MALDTLVSQIAFRARLLERAVHDPGPWTIRFEGPGCVTEVFADREFLRDGVRFVGHFHAPVRGEGLASLCWRGEVRSSRPITVTGDPFHVEWCLRGDIGVNQRH